MDRIIRVHNVSQWPNLRHLGESLGGAEGLLEAVSFKKATKGMGTERCIFVIIVSVLCVLSRLSGDVNGARSRVSGEARVGADDRSRWLAPAAERTLVYRLLDGCTRSDHVQRCASQ